MTCEVSSHEGTQRREPTGRSWRRGGTTWGIAHPRHFKHEMKGSWTEQVGGVKANEGPFKAPSGRGKHKFKGDREVSPGTPTPGLILQRFWAIRV